MSGLELTPRGALDTDSGWKAELGIDFSLSHGRTILSRRHTGPLTLQRPFYPEGDAVCHVYALHPPGGVVGGDRLRFDVRARTDAHGLVTTPAAGKFYRSAGPLAVQEQRLRVDAGGTLDWLPLETIVYPGADARLDTRVDLAGDACFFGWEVVCLGLPASGAPFDSGRFIQSFEVHRDGGPVLLERARYQGGSALLTEQWGLDGFTVFGTLIGTVDGRDLAERIRGRADELAATERFSLTQMDGLTVCRVMGDNAFRVRDLLAAAWGTMRMERLGRAACPPRVWNT
ncbi:Urease accessory protein UreD [Pseudodesulfovibrio hydrargyri]|uniref:Urease accessory protein UreD n=1 Tax=Pseudodesulfovibrio hydrargyri TaxID=2125990 RepID=A0A1J5MQZ0_9BACT|nr:urease accessory protein UreD [Pseudodesulfovibrio hydrargyri]OIQ49029.1 Urease accessory protein UreD [Pseudodesulfovibrio hydrargyri]